MSRRSGCPLARRAPAPYIRIVTGDAWVVVVQGLDEGQRAALPLGRRLIVGRGAEADLRLRDANVSRAHCALERRVAGVVIEDLGSRFGTHVADAPLEGPRLVSRISEVRLGDTVLRVEPGPGPTPPGVPGYRLERPLGDGGGGVVWSAVAHDGRPVAVKVMAPESDERGRRRFEREAALLARLDHPAIAPVVGLVRAADGRPCLVRGLVAGRTLEARLEAERRLPWAEVAWLGARLAEALDHAHQRGVVHRDVKPGNVVLGEGDRAPVLIDFDLARRTGLPGGGTALTRLTETGEGLGTLGYLAPEQLTDAHGAGPLADVYGLGATLWHALTGRRPFSDVEPVAFFDALRRRGPGPAGPHAPDAPPALIALVERATAPRPEARPPSAGALAQALRAVSP